MGKNRKRQKIQTNKNEGEMQKDDLALNFTSTDNIFKNMNIEYTSLNKSLSSDTKSVKSFKSLKSEHGGDKAMTKKNKLKLRKEFLLKKIDRINEMKKETKIRNKRKKNAVIGDTNDLYDSLPSLDSLLKIRTNTVEKDPKIPKPKGIHKANKRKKNLIQSVQIYKQLIANKAFKENPLAAITEHVKAITDQE